MSTEAPRRPFFLRLVPPRTTFPADITPAESESMKAHAVYWKNLIAAGTGVAAGPVADPKGAWGMGVLVVQDESELAAIEAGDPAVTQVGMRYELLPMMGLLR